MIITNWFSYFYIETFMFYIVFEICFFPKICYTAVLGRSHEISTDYYNSNQATQYKPETRRLSHEVIQGKDLSYLPYSQMAFE